MISLSGREPERASGPSQTRVDNGGGLQYFSCMEAWALGFSWWSEFIGEGRGWWAPEGPTPCGGAARGGPVSPYGVAASRLFSVSPLDSLFMSDK
jgi:hypothetical protein